MIHREKLKLKILNNKWLKTITFSTINLRFYFVNKKVISGKRNILNISKNSLYRNVKYKIFGDDNYIDIKNHCIMRNVIFEIEGNNNTIIIEESVNFMEKSVLLIQGNNCNIKIGINSIFRDVKMFAGESNTNIEIGKNCLCGILTLSTSDFHSIIDLDSGKRINPPNSIKIGNDNWITNHILIRKGAEIANFTVVSPYSIVNKKFENSHIILAGQPAKIVKENITWSREKLPY
jgi:acetyltransferase-like isoleucine patch superfamily enzyme